MTIELTEAERRSLAEIVLYHQGLAFDAKAKDNRGRNRDLNLYTQIFNKLGGLTPRP